MHVTALLPLLVLAAAAPATTAPPEYRFVSVSTHSGNINYHLQPIVARNFNLYLDGQTHSYCPSVVQPNCPKPGNVTSFIASTTLGSASMNAEVPGGQLLFARTDGSLGYTQAHSGQVPHGAYTSGFKLSMKPPSQGPVAEFTFIGGGATAFFACGLNKQVFANVKGYAQHDHCVSIGWVASQYADGQKPGAWEYI